jgi:hypothetical protein
MSSREDLVPHASDVVGLSRRRFLAGAALSGAAALSLPGELLAALASPGESEATAEVTRRFPYFQSIPVSYRNVRLQDTFWSPRQKVVHDVTVPWASGHWDAAGGLAAFRANPNHYQTQIQRGDLEVIRFLGSMRR